LPFEFRRHTSFNLREAARIKNGSGRNLLLHGSLDSRRNSSYLDAKLGVRVIDVGTIEENVCKIIKQCFATSHVAVPQAFCEARRARRLPG